MNKKILAGIIAAGVVVAIAGGAIALAGERDSEGGVTGPQADRAIRAALAATGEGTANAVERDSENGATWEVEVSTPGGNTVDVRLDDQYRLVVIEGDRESADDGDAGG
jgi:pyrroline-5-carboxylate reductase